MLNKKKNSLVNIPPTKGGLIKNGNQPTLLKEGGDDPVLDRLKKSYPKYEVIKEDPKYGSFIHPSQRNKKPTYYLKNPSTGQKSKITPGNKSNTKTYTTTEIMQKMINK